jgi:LPXTG-site transpeptidase (sortase) family protein
VFGIQEVEDVVASAVSKTLFRVVITLGFTGVALGGWSYYRSHEPPQPDPVFLSQASYRAMHPLTRIVHRGDLLCVLQVPRLDLTVPVVEGADQDSLLHGAGHVIHTAFPGHHGNVGIAAHRDTCFRPLRFIRPGDQIVITSPDGISDYVVSGTEIVLPADGHVLHHTPDRNLTLVTCYPFFYVGSAPKRFIVHATQPDLSEPGSLVADLH